MLNIRSIISPEPNGEPNDPKAGHNPEDNFLPTLALRKEICTGFTSHIGSLGFELVRITTSVLSGRCPLPKAKAMDYDGLLRLIAVFSCCLAIFRHGISMNIMECYMCGISSGHCQFLS